MIPASLSHFWHLRRRPGVAAGFWACGPGRHAWSCGPEGHGSSCGAPGDEDDEGLPGGFDGGGPFGVRRPLRFLTHRLRLDRGQVVELARILNDLKTERAQAEVDRRRTLAAFADAVGGQVFDQARADEAGRLRVESAERVRAAVVKALAGIHGVLNEEQRGRLAYLIRTGALVL